MIDTHAGPACTITIDLAALAENWRRLAAMAAPAECAAVVKADAYGIGIERAAPALAAAGCRTFFVALPDEGRRVRSAVHDATIYVLGGFLAEERRLYREHDLRPVLNQMDELAAWAAAGGGPSAVQVDTGMNRLGFALSEVDTMLSSPAFAASDPRLLISHLACADEPAHPMNARQLAAFSHARHHFADGPASFANSAGILLGPDYHFDLVRPGIALYGALPEAGTRTVVSAHARVLQVRTAAREETIGYGAGYTFERTSRIAILAAGYADGYLRATGSSDRAAGGSILLGGSPCPLIGRVSMDLMAVDVTDCAEPIRRGDLAELFGPNLPIWEAAAAAGTIPYELLTGLSRRAQRIYLSADGMS